LPTRARKQVVVQPRGTLLVSFQFNIAKSRWAWDQRHYQTLKQKLITILAA
jgi:hypothetical protein